MTDKKISALPPANVPLVGTELIPLVQSGTTSNVTFTNFMAYPPGPMYFPNATAIYSYDASAVAYKLMERTAGGAVFVYGYAGRRALRATDGITNIYAGDASNTSVASYTTLGMSLDVGNITPAVAAKGVNFTANTPAAGMTSQLLNWYEEGTWTPNQGAGLTVIGAFSSGGVYTKVGRVVNVNFYVSGATSVAAAAGNFLTTNFPFTVSGTGGVGIATNASPNATVAMLMLASTNSVISAGAIAATTTIYVSATYSV